MNIKNLCGLQRVVGKIDNDFNLSESDWIPRVAAWIIDALSQMKVLPMEYKTRKLEVNERLAQFPNCVSAEQLKVYDKNGCEILELNKDVSCGCTNINNSTSQEIAIIDNTNKSGVNFMNVGTILNSSNKNYVLQNNTIELNFDTDYIIVKSYEVATYYDEYFDCDVPYIYNDGTLIEALCWYCLFKYLSRGSKHPVYDLKSKDFVTNPYVQWSILKPKAINSVKMKLYRDEGWRNFFYNSAFAPKG